MKSCAIFVILCLWFGGNYGQVLITSEDCGEPLFLTPLIETNKIQDARSLAKVQHADFTPIAESYSGFLTANKSSNGNLFFWFFKAQANWESSPLILWLQGGPGSPSMFGLFVENGPFQIESGAHISARKYSWNVEANLLYIDSPVGTGFSFTDADGYASNEDQIAENLYNALTQIFQLFPEIKNNRLILTGESYAGKYIPALAYYIHMQNQIYALGGNKINLNWIAIGNGLTDPINQLQYGDYLYAHGLIDLNALKLFHVNEKTIADLIEQNKFEEAFDVFNDFIGFDPKESLFKNLTGFETHFNYYNPEEDKRSKYYSEYIQRSDIRKAIHVGNLTFNEMTGGNVVEQHLKGAIFKSLAKYMEVLLSHYHVILYNGQLDIICAYPLLVNYLQKLKFSGAEEYKTKKRDIWRMDNEIAGYAKDGGNLTEVLVRNAGHMVPTDQPKWAYDIIARIIKHGGKATKLNFN